MYVWKRSQISHPYGRLFIVFLITISDHLPGWVMLDTADQTRELIPFIDPQSIFKRGTESS